jgi:xanthine dehydrogenase YagR molybdenum-binding subunit
MSTTGTEKLGKPVSRVDGPAKVTGAAKYAAEFNQTGLAYGYVINSPIAKGRIKSIDRGRALDVPGVIEIFAHDHRPPVASKPDKYADETAPPGSPFRPLYDDQIMFSGQPVALVVAEEFELARFAATLVDIHYEAEESVTDLDREIDRGFSPTKKRQPGWDPEPRGDVDKALSRAAIRVQQEYRTPIEHHNPMETFGCTAVWEGDGRLVVYDKTQGAPNCHNYLCNVFGLPKDKVRVLSPYVGGAFGSGLRPNYELFLAVLAAIALERSVRVTLTRRQMFTLGYRPQTIQTLTLGTERDGSLVALKHEAITNASRFEDYQEPTVPWTGALYHCDNSAVSSKLVRLDLFTPCDMRAPGGAVGVYAIESAMDELSYSVGIDPLELRLKNYSEMDQNEEKPFSSKALKDCYYRGAERFGWSKRDPKPRSMREGRELVGYGMATGIWEGLRVPASARASLSPDGRLEIASATADIGTGTYTILTQIGSEMLGLPLDKVTAIIGDSDLPTAPVEGGSWTVASVGSAAMEACEEIRKELFKRAGQLKDRPLGGAELADVTFVDGDIVVKGDPSRRVAVSNVLWSVDEPITSEITSIPDLEALQRFSHKVHAAVFAEVRLDEELGMLRVARVVSAVAAGRILNAKTAHSQVMGAVVGGIGMALHEETVIDQRYCRFINHNFAEYHVPVNADVHDIEVIFVEERESHLNPLGAKGLGEIGIVGTAAAIANAAFHATGVRVRNLPITIDKLLALTQES